MIEQLKQELEADEGRVNEIYVCSADKNTFGVGHMVTSSDEEYGMPIGTHVDPDRVDAVFAQDIENTLNDCRRLYDGYDSLPEEVQLILANMMFNLGATRLGAFKRMNAAIDDQDYATAAEEMLDSKWHRQLPRRSTRLYERMAAV